VPEAQGALEWWRQQFVGVVALGLMTTLVIWINRVAYRKIDELEEL